MDMLGICFRLFFEIKFKTIETRKSKLKKLCSLFIKFTIA